MDPKQLAAALLVIVLLGAAYYLTNASPPPAPEGEEAYAAPFLSDSNTTISEFAQALFHAEKVAIVEDLRELDAYPLTRNNIMQCAVDFSGSEGLVGKELYVYAFEGEACTSNDGLKTIGECYSEIVMLIADASASLIWIEQGEGPTAYSSNLLVRVNEQYSQGDCSVTFNVPQQYPHSNETSEGGLEANEALEEAGEQNASAGEGQNGASQDGGEAQNGTLPEEPLHNETGGELPDANSSANTSDSVTFG